ncbi:MAG: hypothetical protein JXA71_13880 [Chitinispirillaceae bacterium]|nr:hypothetical protein [Chitinispirillaceae bacterium]
MRNRRFFLPLISAVLCAPAIVSAQARADFYLVTDPSVYTIYDQYQQQLPADAQRRFLPGSPFRIIEKDVVLGDQISRALKFGFGREVFYLIREDKDIFAGEKNRSNRKLLTGCEPFGDTVELLTDGTRVVAASGKTIAAGKGERLQRIFRNQGRYYVLTLDGQEKIFGWSALEPKSSWKISGNAKTTVMGSDTLIPDDLKKRVVRRIEQANESYKAVFSHFSSHTRDEKTVPRWRFEHTAGTLRCTLAGPYRNTGEIAHSTRYLQRDIETMLLGTGFWLTYEDGTFLISREAGEK